MTPLARARLLAQRLDLIVHSAHVVAQHVELPAQLGPLARDHVELLLEIARFALGLVPLVAELAPGLLLQLVRGDSALARRHPGAEDAVLEIGPDAIAGPQRLRAYLG
jgi:hypothetical protein